MQNLEQSVGAPIPPAALARWLGIDVKTVRKYADRWGGVEVAPKRVLFFERIVEDRIKAQALQPETPPAPEMSHREVLQRPRHDPFNLMGVKK